MIARREDFNSSFEQDASGTTHTKWRLLTGLKETTERVLSYPAVSIWHVHGGVNSFLQCVQKIFEHQSLWKDHGYGVDHGYWSFVSSLRWLKPTLAVELDKLSKIPIYEITTKESGLKHRCNLLFRKCLMAGNLSECISHLANDRNLIEQHYGDSAFLNDKLLTTAFVLCVRAIETESSSILADLMSEVISGKNMIDRREDNHERVHHMALTPVLAQNILPECKRSVSTQDPLGYSEVGDISEAKSRSVSKDVSLASTGSWRDSPHTSVYNAMDCGVLLPDVVACAESSKEIRENNGSGSADECCSNPSGFGFDMSLSYDGYSSDAISLGQKDEPTTSSAAPMRPALFPEMPSELVPTEEHFSEDVGQLAKRSETVALLNYLRSQDLATCAELKKENAHFHFSEMLITMMEESKCSSSAKSETAQSLPELNVACLRERRDEADVDQACATSMVMEPSPELPNPPPAEVNSTTEGSLKRKESYFLSSFGSGEVNLDATMSKEYLDKSENNTAESVAIGLLLAFSGDPSEADTSGQDLEWMVSEDDVPQALLPLPRSIMIDPDSVESQSVGLESETGSDASELSVRSKIRGNECWAPPRPQIIFSVHKRHRRAQVIAAQKYMCAGCGAFVEKAFIKRFRYCEYMGKYFCSCCHDNMSCVIPAHIFHSFDFKKYKVSNFSFELLQRIHNQPLFNIHDINSPLYSKTKSLATCMERRIQVRHLNVYLRACRFVQRRTVNGVPASPSFQQLLHMIDKLPEHIAEGNVHVYSIEDLMLVKSGEMAKLLQSFIEIAAGHVTGCEICRAKGFICELCGDARMVIFPHQLRICFQCPVCSVCYHRKCYSNGPCPKCARIATRRRLREANSPGHEQ